MTNRVKLSIDGMQIEVPADFTIMQAAKTVGIEIPALCWHNDLREEGNCRVCVVEVEGQPLYQPSCAYKVADGMKVKVNTPELLKARKMVLELILSRHNMDCLNCERNTHCELQTLADRYGMRENRFENEPEWRAIDSSGVVVRDTSKCINCGRCIRACNEVQTAYALDWDGRGYQKIASTTANKPLADTTCINCGQCINVCPTGALMERDDTAKVWEWINDPEIHTVVQTAPAIRASVGEACGLQPGYLSAGKLAGVLKQLGFSKVMDTNFTADLTILEEGTEFLTRVTKAVKDGDKSVALPLITSCSPGWIKFMETFEADFIPNISSCKSPQQMFGALAKTYYAEKAKIDPAKIRVISIMPCTAKKFECDRPEMCDSGYQDVDVVLTTRELGRMIKLHGINFDMVKEVKWDDPMGISTGAADIFANTGGVMEAALRTVYELVTGDPIPTMNFTPVRGFGLDDHGTITAKEAAITIEKTAKGYEFLKGVTVKVAVAHSTGAARRLFDAMRKGEKSFHFIEIMGCPGGCVGGGGQPRPTSWKIKTERAAAIYKEDEQRELRKSHLSPAVAQIYKEFLGSANSHKAHELLHTHYHERDSIR